MKMISKLLRDEWGKLLVFTIFMSAVSVAQVFFWPDMERIFPLILEQIPEPLKWVASGIATGGFIFYTVTQQFMKNIGFFGSAMAILLGASAIAREKEAGTLELLLAQPLSRTRVLTEKFLFNAAALAVPVILSSVLIYPPALYIGAEIDLPALVVASVYCYLILLVVFALTFALGVIVDEQIRLITIGLAVCIGMTILVIFKATRHFSLYGYMDVETLEAILTAGRVPYWEMLIFALLSAGLFVLAVFMFRKRTV